RKLFSMLSQAVSLRKSVALKDRLRLAVPAIRSDRAREPGLLPKSPRFIDSGDPILLPHCIDDKSVEEVRLCVQDAGTDPHHQVGKGAHIQPKPVIDEDLITGWPRKQVVVNLLVLVVLDLFYCVRGDAGLAHDRDTQPSPCLRESRVLGTQRVARLSLGEHPAVS